MYFSASLQTHMYSLPNEVKPIQQAIQCYVNYIWFVRRPKETNYDMLINGRTSQLNDDEWSY